MLNYEDMIKYDRNILFKDGKRDRSVEVQDEHIECHYDTDDNVLFGSDYIKGTVAYMFIPAERSVDGYPIHMGVRVSYDGKGNASLPKDTVFTTFDIAKEMANRYKQNEDKE